MKENFKTAKISGNFAIFDLKNSHSLQGETYVLFIRNF